MQESVTTRLYLMAPPLSALDDSALSEALTGEVACLLVDVSGFVEAEAEALERMIAIADAAECPLVAGGEEALVLDLSKRFALDGVHLSGPPKQVGWVRKQLGEQAIVGYDAGVSRHDALVAAEGGAEYVMLGPVADLDPELLAWWQSVIETPVIASGLTTPESVQSVKGVVDFVCLRADTAAEVAALNAALA